jgi:hypothetical protein
VNRSIIAVPATTALALGLLAAGQGVATSSIPTARTISPMVAATPNGSWSAVGGSPGGPVYALTRDDSGALYVGGGFNAIGGRTLSNVARWHDDTYTAVGAGLDDTVWALAWDDTLYIGGQFGGEVGGVAGALSGVAAWAKRGADDTYISLGEGVVTTGGQTPTRSVRTILTTDDTIYFGGEFTSASSVSGTRRLAGWVDDTWVSVGGGIPDCSLAERVSAFAEFPGRGLVVGGKFRCAGTATEDDTNIATLTGSQWDPMGGGLRPVDPREGDIAGALIVDGATLYVGGTFAEAGPPSDPVTSGSLATWNGSTWAGIGDGVAGVCGAAEYGPIVSTLSLDSGRGLLYAAGAFCRAGDDTVNSIVVRDLGVDEWVPFIAPGSVVGLTRDDTAHRVATLVRDDSVLYVGGNYTLAGGAGGPSNLARWTWDPPVGTNTVTASPGQAVSLSGSRFIGVPATGGVFIGGVPSPSYVRDDTTSFSNVVIPAGISGTVTIEVDAVGGRAQVGTLTVPGPPPPPTPASAPRDVAAAAGDASASVSWAPPSSSGSFPVSTYQAVSSPGGRTCLATAPALSCEVTGLANGTAYTFTVRALTGAGWSAESAPSNAVTPRPEARPSIVITGSREGKRIEVSGQSIGFGMGGTLRPWLRFPDQSGFSEGAATILVSRDGTFEWGRRTGKKVSVYVQTADGSVRSNTVTIR